MFWPSFGRPGRRQRDVESSGPGPLRESESLLVLERRLRIRLVVVAVVAAIAAAWSSMAHGDMSFFARPASAAVKISAPPADEPTSPKPAKKPGLSSPSSRPAAAAHFLRRYPPAPV